MDQSGHAKLLADSAKAHGRATFQNAETGVTSARFVKGNTEIAAGFAGHQWQTPKQTGMLVHLVYDFGDGRHFAVAIDDERRHKSGMSMTDIGLKWLGGNAPSTEVGTP